MSMFYTPKPRQFHYEPRFYDPEKEKWEALKQKYAEQQTLADKLADDVAKDGASANDAAADASIDEELSYFQNRVRQIDSDDRRQKSRFGIMDLFRRRKMPTFNYRPRFQQNGAADAKQQADADEVVSKYDSREPSYKVRIRRRYDMDDPDYMKPVSGGKIMLYALAACLLLYWILF